MVKLIKPDNYDIPENVHNKELYKECFNLFNQPVLCHTSVMRLVGYCETADDCYALLYNFGKTRDISPVKYYNSMVCGPTALTFLKGQRIVKPFEPTYPQEEWSDYTRLDNILELNGVPKVEKFILELEHGTTEFEGHDTMFRESEYYQDLLKLGWKESDKTTNA